VQQPPVISDVNDGGQGCEPLPGKINVKYRPHLAYILVFSVLLVFSILFFWYFSEIFPLILGFSINILHIQIHFHVSIFY